MERAANSGAFGSGARFAVIAGTVALAGLASRALVSGIRLAWWPFPSENFEGGCVLAARLWAQHGALYWHAATAPPLYNYPPLYVALLRLTDSLTHPFLAGRLISLAALATCAALLAINARRLSGRWLLGLAAASFYLIVPEDVIHGTIVRVDALAACLSFLALTIGWRKPSSNAVLAAAAAVGVAAWFTKQTAVLGPAALFLWLLLHNRRRALVFGAMYVGLLAAAIGVAEMAAGGVFLKTVLGYSVAGFSWRKLAFVLYWHFLVHRPIHYLLLLSFLGGAWALVRGGWRATPWPVYFAVCLASLIWLGKAGSSSLYFLEFHLACAIGLAAVLPALRERSARLEAGALVVAAVVCLWSLPDLAIAPFKDRDPAAERVIVAAVRAARGPLLMENAGYAVLAGRDDLDLPNPFLAKTLIERGVIALQPYVDRTREKRYGLIVLDNPAAPPTGTTQDRFPRALLEEIDRSYRLAGAAGGSYFYLPKPADPM